MSVLLGFGIGLRRFRIGALGLVGLILLLAPAARANTSGEPPLGELEGALAVRAIELPTTPFRKWRDVMRRAGQAWLDLRWQREITLLRTLPEETRLVAVNLAFNRIPYREDIDTWGHPDYWASGPELLARGAGDCEDYAIAKYMALHELGYSDDRLFLLTLMDKGPGSTHTVLMVREGAGWVVLDNRWPTPKPLAAYAGSKPLYVLNRIQALWLARAM